MSTQAKARCGKASSGNGLWSHRIHPFFLCPSPKARQSSLPREGPLDFRKGSQQPSAYDTGRDYGARRAPRRWPVGSSKNRPHGQLASSPNTTPGEQRSEALAMRGGLSSWHWVYITRRVPGLGAGPRGWTGCNELCLGGYGNGQGSRGPSQITHWLLLSCLHHATYFMCQV